jgi:transcriptional regulator with XRE-family HTH domain
LTRRAYNGTLAAAPLRALFPQDASMADEPDLLEQYLDANGGVLALAEKVGVHYSALSRVFSGARPPNLGFLERIADATGGAITSKQLAGIVADRRERRREAEAEQQPAA